MFNKYPYTDAHELNLDWILAQIMKLHHDYDEFKAVNTITNAGSWDITKQYQAWTIVSDNNAGYISVQPVPAGVAISNTDYWAFIADYDIVITDLANRVGTLEGQMTNLLNTEIPGIKSDISEVEKIAKIAHNQKILLIGDSYCEVAGTPYSTQLETRYGDRITVLSASGYGFTNGTWLDLITANIDNVGDRDDYSVIIFAGGCNDVSSTYAAIQTAIENTVSYVKSKFVNAKVCLACIGGSAPATQSDSGYYLQNNVKRAYNDTSGAWTYIEGCESTMLNAAYISADGVHPNQDGSDALFRFFVNWISNYSTEVLTDVVETTLTLESPFVSHTSYFLKTHQLNQFMICKVGRPVFTLTATNITENGLYHIGTQDNAIIKTGREIEFTVFGYLKDSTKSYPVHVEVTTRCNDVWMRFHLLDKTSNSWETITGVTEIGLFPHEFITSGQF